VELIVLKVSTNEWTEAFIFAEYGSQAAREGTAFMMLVPLRNPLPKSTESVRIEGNWYSALLSWTKVKNIDLGLHVLALKSQMVPFGQHETPSEQQMVLFPAQHPHPLGPRQH